MRAPAWLAWCPSSAVCVINSALANHDSYGLRLFEARVALRLHSLCAPLRSEKQFLWSIQATRTSGRFRWTPRRSCSWKIQVCCCRKRVGRNRRALDSGTRQCRRIAQSRRLCIPPGKRTGSFPAGWCRQQPGGRGQGRIRRCRRMSFRRRGIQANSYSCTNLDKIKARMTSRTAIRHGSLAKQSVHVRGSSIETHQVLSSGQESRVSMTRSFIRATNKKVTTFNNGESKQSISKF